MATRLNKDEKKTYYMKKTNQWFLNIKKPFSYKAPEHMLATNLSNFQLSYISLVDLPYHVFLKCS